MTTRKDALALARRVGMPYRLVESIVGPRTSMSLDSDPTDLDLYRYDGKCLNVDRMMPGWQIVHEICHWLVAPPSRRCRPEYGLGTDLDSVRSVAARCSSDQASLDEHRTCLLNVIYVWIAGDDGEFEFNWYELCGDLGVNHPVWDPITINKVIEMNECDAIFLRRKGLLDQFDMPTAGRLSSWPRKLGERRKSPKKGRNQ